MVGESKDTGLLMSESDKAVVNDMIRVAWRGEKVVPSRGLVQIAPVLKGGLTDLLINLAVEIADEYYSKRKQSNYEYVRHQHNEP